MAALMSCEHKVARLARALPLVGGIVNQRDETLFGQFASVGSGGLFLDAATGCVTTMAGYFWLSANPGGKLMTAETVMFSPFLLR